MYILEISYIQNEERVFENFLFECQSEKIPFEIEKCFYTYQLTEEHISFLKHFEKQFSREIYLPGFRMVVKTAHVKKL